MLNIFTVKKNVSIFLISIIICFYSCEPDLEQVSDAKTDDISLADGFLIDHLFSPSDNEYGSWVSMTFDDKGRMIASDQFGSLYRLTLPDIGSDSSQLQIEELAVGERDTTIADSLQGVSMGYAQGLLWAYNSLYVVVNHSPNEDFEKGSGLYRLEDTNGDDQFDKVTPLITLEGEGEHGPHSLILSPDGESIYMVMGNHTKIPALDHYLLPHTWDEDNLFPLIKDPQGHATEVDAPGGWIVRTDSVGSSWELVAAGFRNTFDITFNQHGDLFAYDSDMEWDFGMPWYRPTRILHVTSGSEFGWRTGNSKWSPEYLDNLPALLNIGQGSPTNFMSAYDARFPEAYKEKLYAFDWSFGIIYAVDLDQEGASYKAKAEEFLLGAPLPLTDGVIGPDGAMYFLTGGRELESDLYRVYHKKHHKIKHKKTASNKESLTEEHKIRRELETYHSHTDKEAVDFIFPYLNNTDRYIRYTARIALEHQPFSQWKDLVTEPQDPITKTALVLAAARVEQEEYLLNDLLEQLIEYDLSALDNTVQLDLLRSMEVVLYRYGKPEEPVSNEVSAYLSRGFPAESNELNKQYSKLLIYLGYPDAVDNTLELMAQAKDDQEYQETVTSSADLIQRNPEYGLDIAGMLEKTPPALQIYYATMLSAADQGWSDKTREEYFKWFYDAFSYKGGNSYIGFINKARQMALEKLPKDSFEYYNTLSGDSLLSARGTSIHTVEGLPKGPGKDWKLEEALKVVEEDMSGERDFEQGSLLFQAVRCASCHTMKGEGGSYGPDLTQLGNRFSVKDILEKIIEPNKNISDQYGSQIFQLKDGSSILGKLMGEEEGYYLVSQNPYDPLNSKKIRIADVVSRKKSKVSVMPPGTINVLNEEELKDLITYLVSGGDGNNKVYKK